MTQQLNVTVRTGPDSTRTLSLYEDDFEFSTGYMRDRFDRGVLVMAVGVENAVWYPPHAVVKVEVMGTRPEKPRSDRNDDY